MVYVEGPSRSEDRPPHVRAASSLSAFREYLAVVQDDANWLALIDDQQQVTAVPLPPGPHGERVFGESRGNEKDKYDLEACTAVGKDESAELIAFSSGSREGTDFVLRVRQDGASTSEDFGSGLTAKFVDAGPFYRMMRDIPDFAGACLNIEGALTLDGDVVRLFQRGNSEVRGERQPVDATADIHWPALRSHLDDRDKVPPPRLENVRAYELGDLDGVRLTFSDAEYLGDGRVLFSASAEDPESGDIKGSVLGVIEADGNASWAELIDTDGGPFRGKIEGLTRDLHDERKIFFVIDDDVEDEPSKIYEAMLSEAFFEGGDTAGLQQKPRSAGSHVEEKRK